MGRRPVLDLFTYGLRAALSGAHLRAGGNLHDLRNGLGDDGDSTAITFPNPVIVVDQPLTMTGVPVSAIQNVPTGTVVVATFTDPEGADPQNDYSASINWGDGQPSTVGSIDYNSATGVFTVSGAYTYAQPGVDQIAVTVTHVAAPQISPRPR